MTSSLKSSPDSPAGTLSERVLLALHARDLVEASNLFQVALLRAVERGGVVREIEHDAHVRLVALAVAVAESSAVEQSMDSGRVMIEKLNEWDAKAAADGDTRFSGFLRTVRSLVEMEQRQLQRKVDANVRIVTEALWSVPMASLFSALEGNHGK